ncbi:SRP72 RNA-binding domain-containing protein [Perilla frutescens var. frutescens]|nr:SRP72 RNA-binding domain-containing protein [Perilla frutescens var. frutescens]
MAPKAAATAAVPIEDLFTSLNRHIQRSEFHLAVRVSDQVLSIAPGDEDAIMCKVLALIKNDKIDDALSAIQVLSKKSSIDLTFFKAYCLYRQNKLDEALVSLKGHGGNSAAMLATEVQGTIESLRVKPVSSFELAYNVACSLIERSKHKDAEQLLLSARRIGQETLMDENLLDDDIETELAPIVVQLGYVQQVLGNTQEALESYISLIKKNFADETSLAVAKSNLIALKGPKDVSDGLRKLDKLIAKGEGPTFCLASGLDLKLSPKQREAIYVNRLLLLLHSNKLDQARELASALPTMFPNSIMPVLLQAAVHVRENKANKAEEILAHFANKFPDKSKTIMVARAQVAASAGHPQIAAESLLKIQDIQHMPATIATIVALKERCGDIDGADAVFDSAIQWWLDSMAEDNKLDVIMREAALFKLRHGKKNEAARLFEELIKSHNSIEALVGLIQTAAHTDLAKAESYEKQLKPLGGLKGIDVDGLEKTSGAKQIERFDPANPGPPPDPERWLPKRERSSYRPKRKDKRAAQIRGSQGAVAKEAANSVNSKSSQTGNSKGTSQSGSTEQTKPSSKSRKKSRN